MAMGSLWRESATLILASKINKIRNTSSTCDYVLPLLKRSSSSKFLPNVHVFPGGVVDASDFSPDWLKIFKGRDLGHDLARHRAPILQADTYSNFQKIFKDRKILEPDIALRLTAIRETFEESGILLAIPNDAAPGKDNSKGNLHSFFDLPSWKSKVSKDASQFIRMCEELKCCPDVWSLYEWSNWLTPTNYFERRFDTIFFVCVLNDIPQMEADNAEISSCKWCSPSDALKLYQTQKIWLAPPQVYELSRLQTFGRVKELGDFSKHRGSLGIERWYPFFVTALDGIIAVLPGDEMYPTDADITENEAKVKTIDRKMLDLQKESSKINRIEMPSAQFCHPVCNIELPFGHIAPAEQPEMFPNKL